MLTIKQGDNILVSPYTGADVVEINLTNGKAGAWYELIVPTSTLTTATNGFELASGHWGGADTDPNHGWRQADSNGNASWLFNASPTEDIVVMTQLYGWILPPNTYQFLVREFYNTVPIESIDIQITSEATTAIQTATVSVKKGKGKNK